MRLIILLILFCRPLLAVALPPPTGIGGVANHLLDPVSYLSNFIYTACFVIGGSFVFASIIKYVEHRRNPLAVPISIVIFLLIAGLLLLALPFAYLLVQHGQPYVLLSR